MKKLISVLALALLLISPGFSSAQTPPGYIGPPIVVNGCLDLSNNLHYGLFDSNTNGEVTLLQSYLVANGHGTFTPTGYFGPLTRQAAIHFQQSQSITPTVGYVGPITRARIHVLTCVSPVPGNNVSISSLSPSSAQVGASVTINGSRFTSTGNSINFDGRILTNISSSNGTSLVFTVPAEIGPACSFTIPQCEIATRQVVPGPYSVSVSNSNGTSNAMIFTVTSSSTTMPPTISAISAPTHLNVNQTGTWRITASDPHNNPLTYSVNWGDSMTAHPELDFSTFQQSTTFTHSYSHSGTYTVTFRVRNSLGVESQSTITVNVG